MAIQGHFVETSPSKRDWSASCTESRVDYVSKRTEHDARKLAFATSTGVLGSRLRTCERSPHQVRADSELIMSTRYNNGSHYENHQRAAELHDAGAHAHRVGEQQGKQDHLTGHEHSRQSLAHSQGAHQHTQAVTIGHGIAAFRHDDIAALAHELWQNRGCPDGSPQEDWFNAAKELRSRTHTC
jgi:hypothetical protein